MTLIILLIVLAVAGAAYWALTRKDAMEFTDSYWEAHEARKSVRKTRSDKGQKRAPYAKRTKA